MPTIGFANSKGGTGKTTSALLLAEQIAVSGGRVAVLDLDPNAHIAAWARSRQEESRPPPFEVHGRPTRVEDVIGLIDRVAERTPYLVIDLEGSKDQIITYALSRLDLCVVPLDGSAMESRQAAETIGLIRTTEAMIRHRKIPYALLFTRSNAAFRTADERDVRAEMAQNDIPVLPVRLARRAPYTRVFRDSLLLGELPDAVAREMVGRNVAALERAMRQIDAAIRNAQGFAQSVVDFLGKVEDEAA